MDATWEALSLIPTLALILATPAVICHQAPKASAVENARDRQWTAKMIAGGTLVVMALLKIGHTWLVQGIITPPAFLALLGAFYLTWLLHVEHVHSASPFLSLSCFLAFEAVFAVAIWVHALLWNSSSLAGSTLAVSALVKMYILGIHEKSKWANLTPSASGPLDQEETYGFWSRCFSFSLLDQVTWTSASQPATIDINKKHPGYMESLRLRKFTTAWEKHRASSVCLLHACISALDREVVFATVATIVVLSFKLVIPFWIENIVYYAQKRSNLHPGIQTASADATMALQTFIVLVGYLVSRACSRYATSAVKMGVRGVLAEVTFAKLQKRSGPGLSKHVRLSIISEDIPAMGELTSLLLGLGTSSIEVLVSLYFIGKESNLIAGLLVASIVLFALPVRAATVRYNETASKASESRTTLSEAISTTLMTLKSAKALGCTTVMQHVLQKLQTKESEAHRDSRNKAIPLHILQTALHMSAFSYIFVGDFFSTYSSVSGPQLIKCIILISTFRYSVTWGMSHMRQIPASQNSFNRLQRLLQQASYEVDGRYMSLQSNTSDIAVQFSNATLMSEPSGDLLLRRVNLPFQTGTLTVITGDDKRSTLIQAAIGNRTISRGAVQIAGASVSYCGRDIWVQRQSIRRNIIGDNPFRENRYRRVIVACCLEAIISDLPGGDTYIVEADSHRLDATALQRIALARSVYSDVPILILDDVLSYQDATSSISLRHNLFSEDGLLRNGTTTTIVSTNNWQSFTNIGAHFINVESSGRVSRTTEADLQNTLVAEAEVDINFTQQLQTDAFAGSASQLMMRDLLSTIRSEKPIANKIERVGLSRYLGKQGMPPFILGVATATCYVALEYLSYFLVLHWFNSTGPTATWYFKVALIGSLLCSLAYTGTRWIFTKYIGQHCKERTHERLMTKTFGGTYGFFTNDNIDHAIRLFCEGFKANITSETYWNLFRVVSCCLTLPALVLAATYPNPIGFAIVVLGGVALYACHTFLYSIWHTLTRIEKNDRHTLQKHFIETAIGTAYIRAFDWETRHSLQSQRYIDRYLQSSTRAESLQRLLSVACDLAGLVCMVMAIIATFSYGMDPLRLGFTLFIAFDDSSAMENLLSGLNVLQNDLCVMKEVEDFTEMVPQENERSLQGLAPRPDQVHGHVKMTDASFGYGERRLTGVNLDIPPGSNLGIHGPGHCGKSALILALCGALEYTGSITIDGIEIRHIPPFLLADMVTVLPEMPLVIPGATVLQTLFPPDILRPGRLKIHMPTIELIIYRLGLEDIIRDVGGFQGLFEDLFLTPDQMHLFSIARAMIKFLFQKNSVLLIDDVMNKLSAETYALVRAFASAIFGQATNTIVQTFDHHHFTLTEPATFARIEGGTVRRLAITNAQENQ